MAQWLNLMEIENGVQREELLSLHEEARGKKREELSLKEILVRWPRLTSHLICQSLGYFSPLGAANAILAAVKDSACFCEWYCHIAACRKEDSWDKDVMREVTKYVLQQTIAGRHRHKGFMSEYSQGLRAVASELAGRGPVFGSWF